MAIVDFLQCLGTRFLWDHNMVTEKKEVVGDSKFVTYLPIYNTIWVNINRKKSTEKQTLFLQENSMTVAELEPLTIKSGGPSSNHSALGKHLNMQTN